MVKRRGQTGSPGRTRPHVPFGQWPSSVLSHGIWTPDKTVALSPFARVREPGEMGNMAKSAIRALDILELLARSNRPLRAVEIASALELSPSSTHQLLKTMMDAAYLIYDPFSKCYHPSIRAAMTGGSLASAYFGPGAIERLVAGIQGVLDLGVTLSVSQGSFTQIVDRFEAPGAETLASADARRLREEWIGVRVPLFGSCTGAAWLATQSDETVLAAARLCRRALGERAADTAHLLAIVRRTREQGYAFGGVTPDDSSRAISVALPASRDGTILVLSVSAPTDEAQERRDEIARILKDQIAIHLSPGVPG